MQCVTYWWKTISYIKDNCTIDQSYDKYVSYKIHQYYIANYNANFLCLCYEQTWYKIKFLMLLTDTKNDLKL